MGAHLRELESDVDHVPERLRAWWLNYLRAHRGHYLAKLSLLPAQAGRVLEIGSVPGHFTVLLRRLGYDVTGVDLEPARLGTVPAKYGLKIVKVDIETERLPFPDGSFDTIVFAEIIEHLRMNPLHALAEIARVLDASGRLILSTPNITPYQRWRFLFGHDYQGNPVHEFKKLATLGHMGHVRLYSVDEIRWFLEEAGLRIDTIRLLGYRKPSGIGERLVRCLYPRSERHAKFVYAIAARASARGTEQ